MPLYEFQCRGCEHTWEIRLEYKAPYPECPECGGEDIRKVYHPAALIFKGSGWHVTDYGKSGSTKSNGKRAACDLDGSNGTCNPAECPKSEASSAKMDG